MNGLISSFSQKLVLFKPVSCATGASNICKKVACSSSFSRIQPLQPSYFSTVGAPSGVNPNLSTSTSRFPVIQHNVLAVNNIHPYSTISLGAKQVASIDNIMSQVRWRSTKVRQSVKTRFRPRGSGSLKRSKAGCRHKTGKKSSDQCQRLAESTTFKDKKVEKKMQKMLGFG